MNVQNLKFKKKMIFRPDLSTNGKRYFGNKFVFSNMEQVWDFCRTYRVALSNEFC
jgi:hypothetical protein